MAARVWRAMVGLALLWGVLLPHQAVGSPGRDCTGVQFPPTPTLLGANLYGVAGWSDTEVWAVGDYVENGSYRDKTLAERWDGHAWSVVPTPDPGTNFNALNAVAQAGRP